MSSRALRKLKADALSVPDNIAAGGEINQDTCHDTESDSEPAPVNPKKSFNPFDLLGDDDHDDGSAKSLDSDTETAQQHKQESPVNSEVCETKQKGLEGTKRKKKKKKKKPNNLQQSEEDNIEETLKEVNDLLGEPAGNQQSAQNVDANCNVTLAMKVLLAVEHKNLNPDNEMKRIFGSRVVQAEQQRRNTRNTQRRNIQKTWLARPKDSWPNMGKSGLSMRLLETKHGYNYYAFEHSRSYQQVQFQFLDAVESLNPQNIMEVLKANPGHIDSLLQLSEICKMSEDMQMATELIERGLYVFESGFHTLFSLTQGNSQLDYRRPENRAFYLALFRHLVFVGKRGCYRTSLEVCKLLLSLDVDGDPMGVLLMIDFYALRADQYNFIVRMYHEWGSHRNLTQLPNFAFSVPLAMFHMCKKDSMTSLPADAILQDSLLMFPGILLPLLEACGVQPDSLVTKHAFFKCGQQPEALQLLQALYIGRCFPCWKEPEVIEWLEKNVKEVIKRVDSGDKLIKQYATKRAARYQGTPRNIYRHIIISEIKEATLPPHIANAPILSYDPLPPPDSITSYTRPERMRVGQQNGSPLSLFFRSLLPNYNPQELLDDLEGAAGGEEVDGDGQNLRQGVGALMNAMRDLLNNIQPVAPPVENGDNQNEDNADDDAAEWD